MSRSFSVTLLLFLFSSFLTRGEPNALAEGDRQAIDAALADKTPGPATQNLYSKTTANAATMEANLFTRNPDLWIGPGVDLTAISAYSDNFASYGSKFAVTAVSPIHCLGAAHAALLPGTKLNFVGSDNVTVTRRIAASLNPVGDVEVYLLDAELPPAVTPLKTLPADWSRYFGPGDFVHLPVLFVNQFNRLCCAEVRGISAGADPQVVCGPPSTAPRLAFNTQLTSGDSSFPELLLLHGEPVLLSLWHYGGYGAGPLEAAHFDAIERAMHELSSKAGLRRDFRLRTKL